MIPKILTGIIVVMVVSSTLAFAEEAHHKDSQQPISDAMRGGGDMPMMDMVVMHEHMAKMQKTMDKIHRTKDAKERQKFMQQHMQEMHEGMNMMQGMMSGGEVPGKMPGKMKAPMGMMGEDNEMPDIKDMMKRHSMMNKRMDMMQGMMEQMMGHMMEEQGMSIF